MSRRGPREALLLPVLIPVGVLVVIGAALFGFSRILLALTPTAAWITALTAAVGVMTVSGITASRKEVGTSTLFAAASGAAGIAMVAGGVALFVAPRGEEHAEGPKLPVVHVLAEVGAAQNGFTTTELSAPSDEPFVVEFENQDDTAPHNVWIASDDPAQVPDAEIFLQEEAFLGPKTVRWQVEPLAEGEYFFFCQVHPTTMTGTLTAQPGGGGGGGGGNVLVAKDIQFDKDEIRLPANAPSQVILDNRDDGIPHNVSIYRDEAYTDPIVQEEPLPGPREVTYDVPPLEPGTYYFRCDVHPTTMLGIVVVAEGPPGEGGASGGGGATGPTGATGGG